MARAHHAERLTKRTIDALQPGEKRYRVSDTEQRGLKLTVETGGRKWWSVRYTTADAKESEVALGDWPALLVDDARTAAGKARQSASTTDPAEERRKRRKAGREARIETFGKLADHYLKASARGEFGGKDGRPKAESTLDKERVYLGRLKKDEVDLSRPIPQALDRKSLRSIGRADIVGLLEDVRDDSGAGAANSSLATLRRVFAYGIHKGLIDSNPAREIPSYPSEPRDVIATDEQLKALWLALEAAKVSEAVANREAYSSAAGLQLCLLTLQRRGEVARIHRDHVDLDKALWTIPAINKKERRRGLVPLTPMAVEIIREAFKRTNGDWAFIGPDPEKHITPHALSRFMARLRKDQTELGELTPHDLRRTGRTRLTSDDLGVDEITAERVLNHVVGTRQQRAYDWQAYMTQKRAALEAWERELKRIIEGKAPTSNVIPMKTAAVP